MPNPNLTSGAMLPGFYGWIDYNAQGSGTAPTKRCLIWGFVGASAQRTPNYPFLPSSQQDANDGAQQGSDLARAYAAAISQPEAQDAEVWLLPIVAPSGGTASTYSLKVILTGSNPTKAGVIQGWIASRQLPAVGFTTSDTANTIAAQLAAQVATVLDLPIVNIVATGAVVSFTYRHKGLTGEDLPMRFNVTTGAGVKLSPGTLTIATNAGAAGSIRVSQGSTAVSTTLAGTETPAQAATLVAAAFNADTYALTAAVDAVTNSNVNLFFQNDRDVRRITAAVITTTGMTVDLGSGATDGTGSSSSTTANGTQGAGLPTISGALANLSSPAMFFRSWSSPWKDTTTLSAMASQIEAQSGGGLTGQKQQTLTVVSSDAASVAGAIAPACGPDLTQTPPHYAIGWAPEVPVQEYEIAARVAVARASKWIDAPQFNWNGFQLKGSSSAPLLTPAVTQTPDALNSALRTYALAPIAKGTSGLLEITKGRTTSLSADLRLWSWSCEAQAAYHFVDLAQFLQSRFQGCSIVRYSEPRAPGLFDSNSVIAATQERMRYWEGQGNYDGAALLAPAVKATPNAQNPYRVDVDFPESPVLDLDQIVFVGHFTSPAA